MMNMKIMNMKKKQRLGLTLVLLLPLVSCQQGNGPAEAVPQKVTVSGADGFGARTLKFSSMTSSQTLPIETSGEWHVYIHSGTDWLEVTPSSGESAGKINLTVTVKDNPGFSERKTTVSFVSEGIEQKALVTVLQNRLYNLEATLLAPVVNKQGGLFDIAVNSNSRWSYALDDEGKAWLTEQLKDQTHLVLSAASTDREVNHGVITFTCEEDPAIQTVLEVWQKDLELSLGGKELRIGQEGIEVSIPVKAVNISRWGVADKPDWVTVVSEGTDVLTLRFAENTTRAPRQETVTIGTDEDATIKASIIVKQLSDAAPKADLADIVFHEDGSAEDLALNLPVTLKPGDVSVKMNEDFGVYAPVFTHTLGASVSSGYYEFPMSSDFIAALDDDGCTIEALVKLNVPINGSGAKPFTCHRSGGLGFALTSSSNGNQFIYALIQRVSGSYLNNYAYSGLTPREGVYYHMIGVWDKQKGMGTLYLDAQPVASVAVDGDLYFSVKHFTIGGAANDTTASKITAAWNGEVLYPRVYSAVLTPGQIEAAFLATRKGRYILVTE